MFKFMIATQIIGIPVGSLAVFLFGTWTPLMGVLFVAIVLDVISGITKGFYNKELRSKNMSQGMIRKAMIILVIVLANMLDTIMFSGLPVAKTGTISFYIAMEGLSFLENLGLMGVPLPAFIQERLLVLKDKSDSIEIKQVEQIIVKPVDDKIQIETKPKE